MKKIIFIISFLLLPLSTAFADGEADPTVFSMTYPVEEVVVTSPFGWRTHPITGDQKFHSGTDFGYDYGRYIHAAANGIVTYSGWISGYGYTVIISHGGAYETLYGHNQECLVAEGQQVMQGQPVALCGSTGNSTGPHCHFEVRVNGEPTDPAMFLSGLPPASGSGYGINSDFDTIPLTFDAYYDFAKPVREMVDAFGKACTDGLELIRNHMKWLFFVLLTIDLTLSAMKVIGKEDIDGISFIKWMLMKLLFYSFLSFMFLHWGDIIVNTIRNYFGTMGAYGMRSTEAEAGKLLADPTEIVQLGAQYVSPILTYMGSFSGVGVLSHLPILLLCTLASASILIAFFLIGVEFALTYIEFYVTALFGFVSFSFVGFSGTRKYAANAINGVFVCALKLMVFIVVALILSSALKESVPKDYFDVTTISMSANGGNFASLEEFAAAIKQVESSGSYTVYNSEGSGAYGAYQQMPEFWDGRCEAYENDHPNERLCRTADGDSPPNAPSTEYSWCPENQDRVSKYQMQCLYDEGGHSWRYVAARWLGTDSEEYWQKVCNGGGNHVEKTISIIVLLKLIFVSLMAMIFGHADGKTIMKEFGSARFRFQHAD